jgi:hypothetical protein
MLCTAGPTYTSSDTTCLLPLKHFTCSIQQWSGCFRTDGLTVIVTALYNEFSMQPRSCVNDLLLDLVTGYLDICSFMSDNWCFQTRCIMLDNLATEMKTVQVLVPPCSACSGIGMHDSAGSAAAAAAAVLVVVQVVAVRGNHEIPQHIRRCTRCRLTPLLSRSKFVVCLFLPRSMHLPYPRTSASYTERWQR